MSVVKFIIILLSGLEFAVATFNFLEPQSSIIILEDPKGIINAVKVLKIVKNLI